MNNHLEVLKKQMKLSGLDSYLIFNSDPHLNEYLPEHWKIISYLSGFTGSAATLVITLNNSGLWTDSRYYIQAEKELRHSKIKLFKSSEKDTPTIYEFLISNLDEGKILGINSLCVSINKVKKIKSTLIKKNILIKDIDLTHNIRKQLLPLSKNKIFLHAINYSGENYQSKLRCLREIIISHKATHHILGSLDDIAWLFNLRGSDIACNPVFYSYAIISLNEVILFIEREKISKELVSYFHENEIIIKNYEDIITHISIMKNHTFLIDPDKTNHKISASLKNNKIKLINNPTQLLKSQKNKVEIQGMKKTMVADGIALTRFLYWLEENFRKERFTEYDLTIKLNKYRSMQTGYVGESFDSIVGFNKNGAIVHYKPSNENSLLINTCGILLVDSGGQYNFGTTDITRTFLLGEKIIKQAKIDYTLILKGLINLSLAIFPEGTKGCNLDSLARLPMWDHGINYGHGTGHGVGAFLNVHEGPQSIRQEINHQPILEGMITSNEPGIYRKNQYGIRLENLILCKNYRTTDFDRFLCFETLTLFPFEQRLIENKLLNKVERNWVKSYHKKVYEKLSPHLPTKLKDFLRKKCQ